ncbi:endonuclease [Alkalilimnicola sp. S0819]|nr:endonuclease [Alkalilimnicola sp. S0819]MPQ15750.1 endonuclease [Alkalilimnicola sp. S0819]
MLAWAAASLAVLLFVLTALPWSRSTRWWVRGLDFPRLQLLAVALVLMPVLYLVLAPGPLRTALLALVALCLACQLWWVLPYSPLYRREVPDAVARPGEPLSVLTVNVLMDNRNAQRLLTIIRAQRPDVVLALEPDAWWQAQLDQLAADYPHSLKCPLDNLYGMLVYSRLPLDAGQVVFLVEDGIPSAHATLRMPSGREVALHCLHPRPPSPPESDSAGPRDAELLVVGRDLRGRDKPIIVAGDLNDVAWSHTTRLFRKVSGLLDPRVGRGMYNSFHAQLCCLRWPLDHLFHSEHFAVETIRRLPAFGSDHFPLYIRLRLLETPESAAQGPDADGEDLAEARRKRREEDVNQVHAPRV